MKNKSISILLSIAVFMQIISTVTVETTAIQSGGLLMSLTRTTAESAENGNKFTADDGVYADVSELTAWDNNAQITIGGTGRTPIVINNAATKTASGWQSASVVGIDNATSFQIKFSTVGYDDIRFSCMQKSTGSGPDTFKLAYRIGSVGSFIPIDGSTVKPVRVGDDSYSPLEQSYYKFPLPADVSNKEVVELRVYFDGKNNLGKNGNTSINALRITSGGSDPYVLESDGDGERPDHIIINQVFGGGTGGTGAVSNSFFELYNPTDSPINLNGLSLQYIAGKDRGQGSQEDWQVLPLSGIINAFSSFLVVSNAGANPNARYTIPNSDMDWNIAVSNRAFSVALVNGTDSLTNEHGSPLPYTLIDLVGVTNTAENGDSTHFHEFRAFDGISQQASARRKNLADYDENIVDFERVDYRITGITERKLLDYRPRYSGDGAWGEKIFPSIPKSKHLVFSKPSGFYDDEFSLTLSTSFGDGAVIRYTTDGSEPTADSPVYKTPLPMTNRTALLSVDNANEFISSKPESPPFGKTISRGNIIRASVFDKDGNQLINKIYTQSYFIGLRNNYPNYSVISLTTENANLFDPDTGIYENSDERGSDWEAPVHFEIIEPDGTGHSQDMGMRLHGQASRSYPQKSIRLYARSSYDLDNPKIRYDLFDGKATDFNGNSITEFNRVLLRNTANDRFSAMMRDAFFQERAHDLTRVLYQAYRPSVVFINGEFWGYYNIRERIDESFIQSHTNIKKESDIGYFSFSASSTPDEYRENPNDVNVKADYKAYQKMYNWFEQIKEKMSDEEYAQAGTFIDMESYIDYWAFQMLVANGDWPGNNIDMWRFRTDDYPDSTAKVHLEDGRWRYILKDIDYSYGLFSSHEIPGRYENDIFKLLLEFSATSDNWPTQHYGTMIFRKLITNAVFREDFLIRSMDILNTNLRSEVVVDGVEELAEKMRPVMAEQTERWGNTRVSTWGDRVEIIKDFARNRQENYLRQIREYFDGYGDTATITTSVNDTNLGHVKVNSLNIVKSTDGVTDPSNWSGKYLIGSKITVSSVFAHSGVKISLNGEEQELIGNSINFVLEKDTNISVDFDGLCTLHICGECGIICEKTDCDECHVLLCILHNCERCEKTCNLHICVDCGIVCEQHSCNDCGIICTLHVCSECKRVCKLHICSQCERICNIHLCDECGKICEVRNCTDCNTSAKVLNGIYSIQHKGSEKLIGNVGAGSGSLNIWGKLESTSQQFRFERQSDNTYKITSVFNGKVIGVKENSNVNAAELELQDWNGTNSQRWIVTDCGGGFYKLVNKHSGRNMDIGGNNDSTNGIIILQWRNNGTNSQRFKLVMVEAFEYIIGDVNGSGKVSIVDAVEILCRLAELPSDLDAGVGSPAWNAALITSNSKASGIPTISDAVQILCYLAALPSDLG